MQMPFGKYAGQELEDIPLDYLEWLLANVELRNPRLREAVEEIVGEDAPEFPGGGSGWSKTANGGGGTRTGTAPPPPSTPPPHPKVGFLATAIADAVDQWVRRMARQHHPDRGGDGKVMTAINGAADDLRSAIEEVMKRKV